ncbi:hypothetical protein [Methanobrevibacter sp.]|uniref:hypothetical protein n=1 Tax=Methanobrevibacter sp. TaxID=66852 RepID=UPI00386A8BCE
MNIQERILKLNYEHTGKSVAINELLLTIVSKYHLFEPCLYLSEDENWIDVAIISLESEEFSQSMSILKKEITAFGVFNKKDIEIAVPQVGESTEDLYQ